jgi:hypothetical protein
MCHRSTPATAIVWYTAILASMAAASPNGVGGSPQHLLRGHRELVFAQPDRRATVAHGTTFSSSSGLYRKDALSPKGLPGNMIIVKGEMTLERVAVNWHVQALKTR